MCTRNRRLVALLLVVVAGAACGGGVAGGATQPGGEPSAASCTGPTPAHATMCPGADAGLTSDAARVVTGSPCTCGVPCEAIPCSYVCNEGYTPSEGACVIEAVSPPAIQLVDDGDGTVTVIDASAQLVWLRDANCLDTVGGIARPDGRASWAEATAWAAGLADGSCGLRDGSVPGDWGLPTQTELMHLQVDLAAGGPFANVQLDTYWSSFSYFAANAGAVDMYDGQYFDYPKDSLAYVWPIRH